jgi:hypothetical protein
MGICCSQTPGTLRSDGNEIVHGDLMQDFAAIESAAQKQKAADDTPGAAEVETPEEKEFRQQAPTIKSHNENTNVNVDRMCRP